MLEEEYREVFNGNPQLFFSFLLVTRAYTVKKTKQNSICCAGGWMNRRPFFLIFFEGGGEGMTHGFL